MITKLIRPALLGLCLLAPACSDGAGRCVPGQSAACSCKDGKMGAQLCQADGSFAACSCQAPGDLGSSPGAKRIFITRTQYSANLVTAGAAASGLEAADKLCNNAALAVSLGGTWKAWLSDDTQDAIDRIADVGPWQLLDGTKVFNNKANLGTLPLAPIFVTETAQMVSSAGDSVPVWTGSKIGGMRPLLKNSCRGWSDATIVGGGVFGQANLTGNGWTDAGNGDCSQTMHLYCFEQ